MDELERQQIEELREQLAVAQEALRQSEQRAQILAQLIADYAYVYHLTLDGGVAREWTAQAFVQITGFSPEELDARGWEELYHPEDRAQLADRLKVLATLQPDVREWRVLTKSGQVRWLRDACYPSKDPASGLLRVYGVVQDITARRETELEAIQQKLYLEAIFESMADGVFIYNKAGRPVQINAAGRHLMGLEQQGIGSNESLLQRVEQLQIRDESGNELALEQTPYARIMRGEILRGEYAAEIWVTTPTGQALQLSVSGAPILNTQQEMLGAVVVTRDVTLRREQERRTTQALETLLSMAETLVQFPGSYTVGQVKSVTQLQQAGQRLLSLTCDLLNCRVASILEIDPQSEYFEPIAQIGPPGEGREHFLHEISSTKLSDYYDARSRQRLNAGEVVLTDVSQLGINGHPTYGVQQVLVAPILIGQSLLGLLSLDYGTINHTYPLEEEMALIKAIGKLMALVIERDRLLQERVDGEARELAQREANQRMDDFLSMTSHELRSPLTTIKASIQMARRIMRRWDEKQLPAGTLARMHEVLERAERQVDVETRLVNDLLDVSRIQNNKLELYIKPADLLNLVREVVTDQFSTVSEREVKLHLPELKTLSVSIDAARIGQVLSNYLTNAIKYSPADTAIYINVTVRSDEVEVSVRDEGRGLTEEERQQVWQRFYQTVHRAVPGETTGLGLGLYISQTIIQQHHGHVGVESEPGKGSTFWFALPLTR